MAWHDPEFIRLARAVYFENDERAKVKKAINLALGSTYVEEKSYEDYRVPGAKRGPPSTWMTPDRPGRAKLGR